MDQQLIDLIEELRKVTPELKKLGSTRGTEGGAMADRGIDKLIVALGKLNLTIETITKGVKASADLERLAMQKFAAEVDDTTDELAKLTKAEKDLERATREAAETTARSAAMASMSDRDRKNFENDEAKKQARIKNEEMLKDLVTSRDTRTAASLYVDELFRGLTVSKLVNRGVENLAGENVNLLVSLKALTAVTEGVLDTFGKVTGAIGKVLLDLGNGAKSFNQLSPIIDAVSSGLGALVGKIPLIGGALEAGVKVAAEGAKFVLDQLQKTSEAFNELAQVGGVTANGMSGLQQQFIESGMSLDGYKKAITENAGALARFGGTVGQGSENFSKFVGDITTSGAGDALRRLGYSADQIGESAGAFVTQQSRLGLAQRKTNAQLTQGTIQYAKELDLLSKVTGMNRKEIQAQQDAALSEGRFRAQIDEMIGEGNEGNAKALMDFQTQVNRLSPELGAAIRDVSTDLVNSDAAIKGFNSSGGQIQNIVNSLKNGEIDQAEALRRLQEATKEAELNQRSFAKAAGDGQDVFVKYAELSDFNRAAIEGNTLKAQKAQDAQIAGQDKLTNDTVTAQKSMEQLSRQITMFGFAAMPKATEAVVSFTGALNKFVKYVGKELGIQLPEIGNAGGPAGPQVPESRAKAEAKVAADAEVANAKFELAARVNDQVKAAQEEYNVMLRNKAAQEDLLAQRNRIKALEDERAKSESEAMNAQRKMDQSVLEAANERKRLRKIENTLPLYEQQVQAAENQILNLRDKKSKLEEQIANAEKTGMPKPLVEARKLAIAGIEEELLKSQKELLKQTDILTKARKEVAKPSTQAGPLADVIARGESKGAGDYNAANYAGGKKIYKPGEKNVTSMSVGDVMREQSSGQIFAAGRYQVTPNTMTAAVKALGLKESDTFDAGTQDRIFKEFLVGVKRPEVQKVLAGDKGADIEKAVLDLAKEFASVGIPKAMKINDEFGSRNINAGESYYAGVGGNPLGPATITPEQAKEALLASAGMQLPKMALGGVTQGLSLVGEKGPEAVVPLPNGRSIPVNLGLPDEFIKLIELSKSSLGTQQTPDSQNTLDYAVLSRMINQRQTLELPSEFNKLVELSKSNLGTQQQILDASINSDYNKLSRVIGGQLDGKPVAIKIAEISPELQNVLKPDSNLPRIDSPGLVIGQQKIEAPQQAFTSVETFFQRQMSDLATTKIENNNELVTAVQNLTAEMARSSGSTNAPTDGMVAGLLEQLVSLQARNNSTAERMLQVTQS
jgi:hypothetical protein